MTASNIKSQKILAVACFNYDRIMTDSQKSENNLFSDQEILDLIPTEYYNGHEFFDASHYELKRLPKLSNSKMIIQRYQELKQQHYIVSKKVLLLVLQKQLKCAEEFGRIEKIQRDLSNVIAICKICRKDLNLAMHQFSSSSFRILNYFRKRKILAGLLNTLYSVKTIYRTKDRLKQLIIEENYPEVIYLISECQKIAEIYEKYKCVVALYSNLNDILEQVEENLDLSISRVCTNFNVESYASIQIAYSFLDKTQISMDQLHMHFIAAVHNTALTSVLKYAESDKNNQYNCVCQSISQDNFLFCLIDLCRSLLVILKSYYLIIKWHENQLTTKFIENKQHKKLFTHVNQQGIIQKLENGISKIYRDVEKKIVIYLDGFDLIPLKFEEFIQALNVIDRISKIGTQICKKNEAKLFDFIKEKFINFIAIYHASRLDELRIFLENEGWNLCPIKSTFNITQLHEFKTFQRILNLSQSSSNTYENLCTNVIYEQNNWNQDSFDDFLFPFNVILNESVEEDILQNSEKNGVEKNLCLGKFSDFESKLLQAAIPELKL